MKTNTPCAIVSAQDAENYANLKQHADKILQGFEKLNESHAQRAIWELFQNALDNIQNECSITIALDEAGIRFEHAGKPFDIKTLTCLIKQVSSKNARQSKHEVGQYGTGFLATHSFGKKILLSGSLCKHGKFINFHDFEIDRIAENADDLMEKLSIQQSQINTMMNSQATCDQPSSTIFKYIASSKTERHNATNSIKNIHDMLPYVMIINPKLRKVTINDEKITNIYENYGKKYTGHKNFCKTTIKINNEFKEIYSIEKNDIIIILPMHEACVIDYSSKMPRLFFYYPLFGSENFGFNFMVHAHGFAPTEQRDSIHLRSNNEALQNKEQRNRKIIDDVLKIVEDFIVERSEKIKRKEVSIQNEHLLAKVQFPQAIPDNPMLERYFKEQQNRWVSSFRTIELVKCDGEKIISPQKTLFFGNDLLQNSEYFDAIYEISKLFWENIPLKNIARQWTQIVETWGDCADIQYISMHKIAEKISSHEKLDFFEQTKTTHQLRILYEYIAKYDADIFNQYKLLPNIKNDFCMQQKLKTHSEISIEILEISDVIMPDITQQFLKDGYAAGMQFEEYGMENFPKDISAQIAVISAGMEAAMEQGLRHALVRFCAISPNENQRKLLQIFMAYYGMEHHFTMLPNAVTMQDSQHKALQCLLKNFVWELNRNDSIWVENNLPMLKCLISILYDNPQISMSMGELQIFPNQNGMLCRRCDLKIDADIPDEIKNLYDDVGLPTKKIRATLAHNEFRNFMNNNDEMTPNMAGAIIEATILKINALPSDKSKIYDIINLVRYNEEWWQYFPKINADKTKYLLNMLYGRDNESLFPIINFMHADKSKSKILIEYIKKLEKEKENTRKGEEIEDIVRKKLEHVWKNDEISIEKQHTGCDMVALHAGKVMHYIEVKARWKHDSIAMSKAQIELAIAEKMLYSLCCVDLSNMPDNAAKNFENIEDKIKILTNIGKILDKSVFGKIQNEHDAENKISLAGDYRAIVPQKIINDEGITFSDFVEKIKTKIVQNK